MVLNQIDEYGAEKTIEKNSIILKTPSEFNDPFDCYYYISKKERRRAFKLFMNYQFFKIHYNELVINNKQLILGKLNTQIMLSNVKAIAKSVNEKKRYKWMPDIEMYYKLAKYINHKSDDEILKEFDKMVDDVVETIRHSILISCFSLRNDSTLMWSHYAQSHHGACIEYEIEDENYKKVKYSKKPIKFQLTKVLEIVLGHEFSKSKFDYSDSSFLFAIEPVLTKFKGWRYEKEIRCGYSLNKKNPRIHKGKDKNGKPIWLFDMPVDIKKIYMGCEASDEFVNKIKALKCKVPIIKMKKLVGKYGVSPTENQ